MRINFEYMTNLQYKVKALQAQVDAFQSGEAYLRQKEEYEKRLREKDRIIAALKKELGRSHAETITMRDRWMEVFEDLEKEHRKAMSKEQKKTARMEQRILAAEKSEDRWHEKWKKQQVQLYAVWTELEEEKEKNRKLTAQVNKDFENSSIPSSMQGMGRKKIPNSRVKTGKRPGGQPGHKGHRRKLHVPTETHELPAPKKYQDSPDYYETGKVVRKQKVEIHLGVRIIEYTTKEYRDRRTGARVHAPFPAGYENEVNYGGSVKALAFLLGNECNVSHGKIRKLIEELTEGEIRLSDGMINGLCREFSAKTKEEKQEIIKKLMTSPVMNADFTNANVNHPIRSGCRSCRQFPFSSIIHQINYFSPAIVPNKRSQFTHPVRTRLAPSHWPGTHPFRIHAAYMAFRTAAEHMFVVKRTLNIFPVP